MIDTILQQAMATWPADLHQLARALRMALPVLTIGLVVWLVAKAVQRLIDRPQREQPAPMRTADAAQAKGDVEELLWRGAQGFENTYPVEPPPEPERPRRRAGPPVIVPFPQPDAEVRNPRHLQRRP